MINETNSTIYDALHIGRSKCASTYLQRAALRSHPQIDLFFEQHKEFFHRYWNYDFGDDTEGFLESLRRHLPDKSKPTSLIRVFSHETLTGHMFHGKNSRLIADLTYRAFGPIKVFVIVREPYAYIYSVWNQHIQEGGVLSFKDFLCSEVSPAWCRTEGTSRLWKVAMNMDLIRYWKGLFGQERLGVFLLEEMVRKPEDFWPRLYSFLGVDNTFTPPPTSERSAYPNPVVATKRQLNRFLKTAHNPAGIFPASMHWKLRYFGNRISPRIQSRKKLDARAFASSEIKERIKQDNQALGEFLGKDLSSLGYEL